MNPSKKSNPERDHVGPKETGGMTSAVKTPATSGLGVEVPKVFDAKGTIGKQFTGMVSIHLTFREPYREPYLPPSVIDPLTIQNI